MKQSAGILLFRRVNGTFEFFLVHMGGPFFIKKDAGWWTIPKGEITVGEAPMAAAVREFEEETGYKPSGEFIPLLPVTQKGGKQVICWAVLGDLDPLKITSNTFTLEWPPKSGKMKIYPEIDKAGWFSFEEAKRLINGKQADLLDQFSQLRI